MAVVKVFQVGKWVEGWLDEANGGREFCEFSLRAVSGSGSEYVSQFVNEAFHGDWTGGNDFGHRAYIGEFLDRIEVVGGEKSPKG